MKRYFYVFIFLVSLASCEKEKSKKKTEEFIIPKQSEMAALMNEMFHESELIKQKVLKGETPENFPERFLKIHTATLTDPSDRNDEFKAFSDVYLANFERVFEASKDSLQAQYNTAINSCIACHKTTCIGPIPRIKKLLIQ